MRGKKARFALLFISILCFMWAEETTVPEQFLQRKGTSLFLDGKPFYEISFNKFDLIWQLIAEVNKQNTFGPEPGVAAERSLKTLSSYGFKTIRIFSVSHHSAHYVDPQKRENLFIAIDKALELCDRYGLRVVFCLGSADDAFWSSQKETLVDLMTMPESKSRQISESWIREVVTRYRDRKTIAAWEVENELLLHADIGGKKKIWSGKTVPFLEEVAAYHQATTALIRRIDPHHLINSGDTYRECTWHNWQANLEGSGEKMWVQDTPEQLEEAVSLTQKGFDFYSIHYYHENNQKKVLDLIGWKAAATKLGQPLYVGEIGMMAKNRKESKFWKENPDWFESIYGSEMPKAQKHLINLMNHAVEANVDLTHYWTFQSDRNIDQTDPQAFTIDPQKTPELFQIILDANERLQMKMMGFTYIKKPKL